MYEHETVKKILETAIASLIENFAREPFMHRCEHSIHCELYNMLSVHRALQGLYPIKHTEHKTTLIHKEWPETIARPEKKERRGNFDLAILDPKEIAKWEIQSFTKGLIPPAFVVEMGLNYGLTHLRDDYNKLTNSDCKDGYLVHLWQPHKGISETDINELMDWFEKDDKVHGIAAVVFVKGVAMVKHLDNKTFFKIDDKTEK